jgi:peptidoglycan/xylan/chitin deacetylase (PgdA/CDA1 family)
MARRRTAVLALTLGVLALALAGCATRTDAGAQPVWHSQPAAVSGQGGGGVAPAGPGNPASPKPSTSPATKPGDTPKPPPTSEPPTNAGVLSPSGSPGSAPTGTIKDVISRTGSKSVALTFDDGPGAYTDNILDLLAKYHVKATFCIIGEQVHTYAAQIRRMVAEGHTLCNHTWDHDEKLRNHDDAYIRNELVRTNDAIQAVAPGAKIEYFRNPGGAFGPNTVRIAESLGMKPMMWNVDPSDWKTPGTGAIISNVKSHTHAGSIILSHDGGGDRTQTVAAYSTLLPWLRSHFKLIAMPNYY